MFNLHKKLALITLATTLIVSGCEVKVKPVEGGKEIARELERHKIKRVTDQDFLKAARVAGDSLVKVAQLEMDKRLQQDSASTVICEPEKYDNVQALAQTYGATIHRTLLHSTSENTAAILTKYKNGTSQAPQVGEPNEQVIVYTAPIYIRNQSSLHCYTAATASTTNVTASPVYKVDDLAGVWQITFDKKAFVKYLNDQPKKKRFKPRGLKL